MEKCDNQSVKVKFIQKQKLLISHIIKLAIKLVIMRFLKTYFRFCTKYINYYYLQLCLVIFERKKY